MADDDIFSRLQLLIDPQAPCPGYNRPLAFRFHGEPGRNLVCEKPDQSTVKHNLCNYCRLCIALTFSPNSHPAYITDGGISNALFSLNFTRPAFT
jgi:hypothetical protein